MRAQIARGVALAGVGISVSIASTAARRSRRRAEESFYAVREVVPPPADSGAVGTFPVFVHRSDVFAAAFPADLGAVTAVLPSERLHPVRTQDGRAVVIVQAVRYDQMTCQHVDGPTLVARPYGQTIVGIAVTPRAAPPMLPLLPMAPRPFAAGIYALSSTATTREARDADRLMGFPTFLADLDFEEDTTRRAIHVAEGGRDLMDLSLDVPDGGRPGAMSQAWYTVYDGRLHETRATVRGFVQGGLGGSANLVLGGHPVADGLRQLGVGSRPILTMVLTAARAILPAPVPIGPARATPLYLGGDAESTRYTVKFPCTDRIDLYGPVGMEETAALIRARVPRVQPIHA